MSKQNNQAIIRKGQHKPYAKATRKQIEERIQGAALLQFCGLTKMQVHEVFRKWFGIEWRQTDRYMAIARAGDSRLQPGNRASFFSML